MPKSDTWRDGNALDMMREMDSIGSCDSVSDDDSLEYLSAEEKACLMFLEETIQSLDTEDDSGLSNDESDKLPAQGNVATKAAHLSASIGLKKLSAQDVPKLHSEDPLSSGSSNSSSEILNYMVPTPFVLANRNSQFPANTEEPKMGEEFSTNLHHSNEGRTSRSKTLNQNSEAMGSRSSKPTPPPVAPKPKMKTPMNQEGATVPSNMSSSGVLPVDKLTNPEKVRLEALCKLGLLKEEASKSSQHMTTGQNPTSQQLKHSQTPTNSVQNQTTGEPLPPRPGNLINQPVLSCNPLRQRSMSDLCTAPSHPQHASMTSARKAATLECNGMEGHICTSNHGSSSTSITDLNTHGTKIHLRDTQIDASESTLGKAQESQQVSSSHSKPTHVVLVHSIGKDRREALRKLGLLKN